MHTHTRKHACVLRCVAEHLGCVTSKLGTDGVDVGRIKQAQPLLVWPRGPVRLHACGGYVCALPMCPVAECIFILGSVFQSS